MKAYLKTTNEKVIVGRLTSKGYETSINGKWGYTPKEDLIFPPTDKQEFLTELKTLMEKYNATIDWCCSDYSDLASVYDSRIIINLNDTEKIDFNCDCIDVEDVDYMLKKNNLS